MKINFQNTPKNLDEKMVYNILRDYKILNCEVLIRDDEATVDDLIDVIMKNHRTYIKVSFQNQKKKKRKKKPNPKNPKKKPKKPSFLF